MEKNSKTDETSTNFEHIDAAGTVISGIQGGLNDRTGDERLLKINEVADRLTISTRSVWRLIAGNDFPKPVVIGRKTSRFVSSEIEAYVEKLKQNRTEV